MNTPSMTRLTPAQQNALLSAQEELQLARIALEGAGPHRSLLRTGWNTTTLLGVVLMSTVPMAVLLMLHRPLMALWHNLLLWWAERLALPLTHAAVDGESTLVWLAGSAHAQLPSPLTGTVTAALIVGAYVATYALSDRQLPIKYVVRVLCFVQASALIFFLMVPSRFAHTLSGYLSATLDAGFALMLVLPVLLAFGWGVLRVPTYQKLLYPALLVGYFVLMVPHKALLHLLILQQFSVLFMPIMYIFFGAMLDLMIFVALYSWLASMAPADAISNEFKT